MMKSVGMVLVGPPAMREGKLSETVKTLPPDRKEWYD
jgi:hypothetical protein